MMGLKQAQFEALFAGLDWRHVKASETRPPAAPLGLPCKPLPGNGRVCRI
jgi:transposase